MAQQPVLKIRGSIGPRHGVATRHAGRCHSRGNGLDSTRRARADFAVRAAATVDAVLAGRAKNTIATAALGGWRHAGVATRNLVVVGAGHWSKRWESRRLRRSRDGEDWEKKDCILHCCE